MHSDSYQYLDTVVFERLLLYIAIYLTTIALLKYIFFQYIMKHLLQLWKHKFYLFDEHSFFAINDKLNSGDLKS